MKKTWLWMICIMIIAGTAGSALAFNSGSTGADGAFSPTVNTEIQLPESGILNYTTVNIPTGVTVTFKKNTTNTPVYLLATGDVSIAGTINVKGGNGNMSAPGSGGPRGFDGGVGASPDACGGTGMGPGGGKNATRVMSIVYASGGGGGGFSSAGATAGTTSSSYSLGGVGGTTYGNVSLLPLIGGSGGGGGCASASASTNFSGGGGGGGGAILIASSGTIDLTGTLTADGGVSGTGSTVSGSGGGGSGGAIKLMADLIKGNGTLTSVGGSGTPASTYYAGGIGGNGRIRLEANTLQRTAGSTPQYSFSTAPVYVFPPSAPSLKIASVGGKAVADNPTGKYSSPDVILSSTMTNPIEVVVQASNIPVGSTVSVSALSELGNSSSVSVILAGTDAASSATAQINLSQNYANVLMATATFTVQASSGDMPIYADGEKVIKMRVTSVLGDKSSLTYITESGKEVRAGI